MGAPARYAATGSASSVADITTSASSGRALAQPRDQREREIAVEVALVELVDDHAAHAPELGVAEQPPRQHTLGDQLDPGRGARLAIEAHLVADLTAEPDAALLRDPRRGQPCGEPPGLENDVVPVDHARVDQRAGHARRLACARRCDEHAGRRSRTAVTSCGQNVVDRQRAGTRPTYRTWPMLRVDVPSTGAAGVPARSLDHDHELPPVRGRHPGRPPHSGRRSPSALGGPLARGPRRPSGRAQRDRQGIIPILTRLTLNTLEPSIRVDRPVECRPGFALAHDARARTSPACS